MGELGGAFVPEGVEGRPSVEQSVELTAEQEEVSVQAEREVVEVNASKEAVVDAAGDFIKESRKFLNGSESGYTEARSAIDRLVSSFEELGLKGSGKYRTLLKIQSRYISKSIGVDGAVDRLAYGLKSIKAPNDVGSKGMKRAGWATSQMERSANPMLRVHRDTDDVLRGIVSWAGNAINNRVGNDQANEEIMARARRARTASEQAKNRLMKLGRSTG